MARPRSRRPDDAPPHPRLLPERSASAAVVTVAFRSAKRRLFAERTTTLVAGSLLSVLACAALLARIPQVAEGGETVPAAPPPGSPSPFGDFDDDANYPTADQLRAVLAEVPGERYDVGERKRGRDRRVATVSGLFRVNLPWAEDEALRLSFWEPQGLQLHLWNGSRGVTLRYHRRFHQAWAAYGTTRENDSPKPADMALWATDGGRYRRLGVGTVEVHFGDGLLTLARGDVPLLTAPMDGLPSEVFLEGSAQVRGLATVESTIVPEPPRERPVVFRVTDPARLDWTTSLSDGLPEGVALEKLPDGRVELRAEERTKEAQAGITVGEPGLYEYRFQVEAADPGTGVYLGDSGGTHICRVGFFRHRETGRTVFGLLPPWQREIDRSHDVRRQVVPYAGPRPWIRVVLGAGVAKLWTSGDGVHWSLAGPGAMAAEGGCTTVGLYCLAHDKPRAIRLRGVEVRRLDAFDALVPEAVGQQVDRVFEREEDVLARAETVQRWDQWVAQLRRPEIEAEPWSRACAIRTLAAGAKVSLAQPLLDRILQWRLERVDRLEDGLRLLDDAALLDNASDWAAVERFTTHYERLGRRFARRGAVDVFSMTGRALVRSPFWSERRRPAFSDDLLRHELLAKVAEDRWPEVAELCRRVKHWGRVQEDPPPLGPHAQHLAEWGAAQAAGFVPEPGQEKPAGVPLAWRHPLAEQLSREGYNVLAELEAALEAEAYREACQVISMTARAGTLGLLPDRGDPRLWTSLPLAIDRAMQEHPSLAETMQEEFAALAELRVKQGIADGDVAAVRAALVQFHGTHAAAEAHRWLGDRCLAAGRFLEASAHYDRALRSASDDRRGALLARRSLAGAFSGCEAAAARPAGPVEIAGRTLSAGRFEALLSQVRRAREQTASADDARQDVHEASSTADPSLAPGRYGFRPWGRVDGRRVHRPSVMPEKRFDWAGRQIAVLAAGRWMLVNNQLDQITFDLSTGREVWAQCRAVDSRYQQWPGETMQPVLAGDRVFVRQLSDEGPELVAMEAATGRIAWSSRPDGHVATDPFFLGPHLAALTVSYGPGEKLILALVHFDHDTGRAARRVPLAEFRDRWEHRISCRATVAGGKLLVSAGGALVCCEVSGRVAWQRRQVWVPPAGEYYHQATPWFEQVHEAPLVEGDRVFAAQPGVWAVECVELGTGQLLWRRVVSTQVRLAGLAAGRLIVQTAEGLSALDPDSGEPIWHCGAREEAGSRLLHVRLAHSSNTILACYGEQGEDEEAAERPRIVFRWIDAAGGQALDEATVDLPEHVAPWLGPLVTHGRRHWVFPPSTEDRATRQIMELVRTDEASGSP